MRPYDLNSQTVTNSVLHLHKNWSAIGRTQRHDLIFRAINPWNHGAQRWATA